jgi:ABC-2 type transport system permease protein
MVATLVRLKLRLLVNTLRREVWRMVLLVLGVLYGAGALAALARGMVALGGQPGELRLLVLVLAGSALVAGWALVPLVAFGVDDTLDPQRFALFRAVSPRLAVGLAVAGAVGIPGLLTVLAAQLPVLAWTGGPHGGAAAATAVAGGLLAAATCVLLARVVTTAAGARLRSRRGRDTAALVGILLLVPLVLVPLLGPGIDLRVLGAWLPVLADVLAWTPLGAPWAAPGDAAAGAPLLALARLAVAAAGLLLLARAWGALLPRAMEAGAAAPSATRRRGDGGERLAARLAAGPLPPAAAAIAARSLRYWRTDPRYLGNAVGIAILPLVATVVLTAVELDGQRLTWAPLVTAPVLAALAGWTVHNDTAMDSTALWMHLGAGVPGRADRLGRVLGAAAWMVPAVVVLAVAGAGLAGRWDLLPALLGLSLALLGAGLGVSAVASGLVVYPVQPPGSSPFSSASMGNVGLTLLAQAATSAAVGILALPALVTAALAVVVGPAWGWLALAVGVAEGAGLVAAGVVLGGRALDARGPALLAAMRAWPRH